MQLKADLSDDKVIAIVSWATNILSYVYFAGQKFKNNGIHLEHKKNIFSQPNYVYIIYSGNKYETILTINIH